MGALPTGVRAELGVRSLRPICLAALRAPADARQHRRRPMRMKPRPDRVASVESVPCKVLLAAHGRPFEPAQAAHRHDVRGHRHEGRGLLGGGPVRFEQQPRRQDAREVSDQGVHERARVGRVVPMPGRKHAEARRGRPHVRPVCSRVARAWRVTRASRQASEALAVGSARAAEFHGGLSSMPRDRRAAHWNANTSPGLRRRWHAALA